MSTRSDSSSIQQQYSGDRTESQNIMHDRRVIRGSTYSLRRSIENRLNDINQQTVNSSKRSITKRRLKPRKRGIYKNETKTPRPVTGRLHAEIQTEAYLEQIYVTKNEKEFGTQTDPFLDRPSTPLFIPKFSGKSISTQIEDGDLFDFDHEIETILQVLIGKTIETSLMEVLEEQELKAFQKYKQQFEQRRNVELAKCQRFEEEQRRTEQEKENRRKEYEIQKKEELMLKKRIDSQRIATEFMQNIENDVLNELDKSGHFDDPIIKEIETIFIPHLICGIHIESSLIIDHITQIFTQNIINDSIQIMDQRHNKQKEYQKQQIFEEKLNEIFVEKRRAFTQSIKEQRADYDLKQQIVAFLNIPVDDDFVDGLMERFQSKEEPLWKLIKCILDKIGGKISYRIERIDEYLERFSIKCHKKELLETFKIYGQDDEDLKGAISDCLGIDTFNEEMHGTLFESLKSGEPQNEMNAINELLKDKENIKQFVTRFIKEKEEERIATKANEDGNE